MHLIIKAFERNAETVDWISQQTIKSVKEKVTIFVIFIVTFVVIIVGDQSYLMFHIFLYRQRLQ